MTDRQKQHDKTRSPKHLLTRVTKALANSLLRRRSEVPHVRWPDNGTFSR